MEAVQFMMARTCDTGAGGPMMVDRKQRARAEAMGRVGVGIARKLPPTFYFKLHKQ